MITGCQKCSNDCMQMAEPKHYAQIVYVLKRLIKLAERRALAWPYLEVAKELLEGFSDANCPISPDDLGWLLSESWNKGTRLMECPSKCPSEYLPVSAPFIDQAFIGSLSSGVACFQEEQLEEAERWMALAFSFSTFSAALAGSREELDEQYQVCLKQLHQHGAGSRRSTEWQGRMGKRILEADNAMARKRIAFV